MDLITSKREGAEPLPGPATEKFRSGFSEIWSTHGDPSFVLRHHQGGNLRSSGRKVKLMRSRVALPRVSFHEHRAGRLAAETARCSAVK